MWFEIESLEDDQKTALYFLCSYLNCSAKDALDKLGGVQLTEQRQKDAADALFDEIYLSDIPEPARYYIDYEKFARDCQIGGDMVEFSCGGTTWTCLNPGQLQRWGGENPPFSEMFS